jgi:fibronectin-binding autotransporter adhesin
VAFAGSQRFSVAAEPIVRHAAVIEVGLNAAITKNGSLGVWYSGQLGNHTQDNSFAANLNYRF